MSDFKKSPLGPIKKVPVRPVPANRPVPKSLLTKKLEELKKAHSIAPRYVILYVGLIIGLFVFFSFLAVAAYYLHDVPSIEKIEDNVLPESTVIYDRDGNELYNLYSKEKRTYVGYDQISPRILGAIVSTEDKTFFENQGVDFRGLVRSALNYVTGRTDRIQGTSTISQQLIKNMLLSNERSLGRKIKEFYLSYQLNAKYSKEKILELYLNKIEFGNNSSGIEEASKTYFGKSSKEVGVLGASILASLPKGPTYYSPYSHRDRLMGYLYVYEPNDPKSTINLDSSEKINEFRPLVEAFKKFLAETEFKPLTAEKLEMCGYDAKMLKKPLPVDGRGCSTIDYSELQSFLNNIRISLWEDSGTSSGTGSSDDERVRPSDYVLEYNTGRKDFVLGRMFEDQKITALDYQNAVIGGIDFEFQKYNENIKYPHFVFYVKEYLEDRFGKDFQSQGWLKIYTTIDPSLQDKAEEIVAKQAKINATKYGAKSAALVSIDNKTGQILSMVGSADYFNDEEDGNVNIITSRRQPGSSFKPLVYALAISKNPIGPDTPIYDVKTKFGDYEPNNYDEKFLGRMPVRKALDYSRNIPAVKMLYVAGGEARMVEFAQSLGITSLSQKGQYGAPLAIGAGEVRPIEMVQAYSVFANGGYKKELTPILKITDRKGNIIEQFTENAGKKIFSDAASYVLSVILSDASSRPSDFWNNVLTLKDRPVAAKTGTSNKEVSKKGEKKKILPRDLWTAGYTPQITTVVWAGNVDGTETKGTADGLTCAAPIWHDFMAAAHAKLPKETFKKPESVLSATISKLSGRLASESTPDDLRVTTVFAVKPTEYEGGFKQREVDTLCNGPVTEATPKDAIKTVSVAGNISPIIDSYDPDWLSPIYGWAKSDLSDLSASGSLALAFQDEPCVRPNASLAKIQVSSSFENGGTYPLGKYPFTISYESDNPIVRVEMLRGGKVVKSASIDEQSSGVYKTNTFEFDESFAGAQQLTLRAIDRYGYAGSIDVSVTFAASDAAPGITVSNPTKSSGTKIYPEQFFNLRFSVSAGGSEVTAVNIYLDGQLAKILSDGPDYTYVVNEAKDLPIGDHTIDIEAIDAKFKKTKQSVSFEIIPR